jgi:putative membrane protein
MFNMMDRFLYRDWTFRDGGLRSKMWEWMTSHGWVGWVAMGVGMLIFLALLVTAIVLIVKAVRRANARYEQSMPPPPASPAMKILDERYAKGEIGEEEYKTKKENLK